MDLEKLLLFLIILKKYINDDELNFLLDGIKTFYNYDKILIEYSIKYNYVNNKHIKEDRILFGLKYNNDDQDKYFNFLNIKPIDVKENIDSVYFSIDKSKNIKKIYFFEEKIGGICNEYKDDLLDNVKNYKYIDNISSDIYNYIPLCLKKIIIENTLIILYFKNKDLDIYQFILKDPIKYNEDFDCYVISICFDNDYNIKYHTYYLRNISFALTY